MPLMNDPTESGKTPNELAIKKATAQLNRENVRCHKLSKTERALYEKYPVVCPTCRKPIPYEFRSLYTYCSRECAEEGLAHYRQIDECLKNHGYDPSKSPNEPFGVFSREIVTKENMVEQVSTVVEESLDVILNKTRTMFNKAGFNASITLTETHKK